MIKIISLSFVLFQFVFCFDLPGQDIHYWESVVTDNASWHYAKGFSVVSEDWINPDYDVSSWNQERGGFGNGDDDDHTIIDDLSSLYMRTDFDISDINAIEAMVLHADFDDGFVAYLNGSELARCNLGVKGVRVPFDSYAYEEVEAQLYTGNEAMPFYFCQEDLGRFLVQGKNTLAIQVHNSESGDGDFSSNFFLSVATPDDSNSYGPLPHWFNAEIFESQIPIIKISTIEGISIFDERKVEANMGIGYNENSVYTSCSNSFDNYNGKIGIEYRGTSSLEFPKKSYGIETRNEDGSNNNVSLLGMPKENDWVLHGPYSDKSLIRNEITMHFGSLTGQYSPKTHLCELFINEQYQGVYLLMEKIKRDKNRVDISRMTSSDNSGEELSGGYMFKVESNIFNLPDIGWESSFPSYNFVAFVYPKHDSITGAQENYLKEFYYNFEEVMYSDDYEEKYLEKIDLNSWVDYFLVTEITKHIDAYKRSFYMHKPKDSKGGKLHFGPLWDFNLGYGNFDFACPSDPEGWSYEFSDCGSKLPFWVEKLISISNVQHLTKCRWEELRSGPFRTDSLLHYIDASVEQLGASADRNFEKWKILGRYVWPNQYVGETYAEEIAFIKNWLEERLAWMDANLEGNCEEYISSTEGQEVVKQNIWPNPATNVLNIELSKNGIGSVGIFNYQGKELINQNFGKTDGIVRVNIQELEDGLYYATVKHRDIIKSTRFVKSSK